MRRQSHLNPPKASAQQGFALFMVLMMMLVIALLVVAATQSYNTEQRISSNDSDRKYAMSLSEAALRAGESAVLGLGDEAEFTEDCSNGLCAAVGSSSASASNMEITVSNESTVNAWERECDSDTLCIDTNGLTYTAKGASQNARYIIEYIKLDSSDNPIFRVTAKAWGKNSNTVVMTQSYVAYE
ncbi:pilus assembly PilX family protein [Neisseria perflava]|uniref:pilus assembly PilX family protein n=1 Tax=Neisseria perflava TaxID=33053 RepID=UPI00209FFD57|nr:pilus assembly protein [Neisseria perflava]MCP1660919.1 type IV pilus assembly protein PilX [Neisseria perflava]MCP1771241.1 type IV pilus assembly protein PilX [Neisseria perflava]